MNNEQFIVFLAERIQQLSVVYGMLFVKLLVVPSYDNAHFPPGQISEKPNIMGFKIKLYTIGCGWDNLGLSGGQPTEIDKKPEKCYYLCIKRPI